MCIDNSGACASYGIIANALKMDELVEIDNKHNSGSNCIVRRYDGTQYLLNKQRFRFIDEL